MKPTALAIRQVALILMLAMGGFAAQAPPAAQAAADGSASCDQWNTKEFFQAATVEEVATMSESRASTRRK